MPTSLGRSSIGHKHQDGAGGCEHQDESREHDHNGVGRSDQQDGGRGHEHRDGSGEHDPRNDRHNQHDGAGRQHDDAGGSDDDGAGKKDDDPPGGNDDQNDQSEQDDPPKEDSDSSSTSGILDPGIPNAKEMAPPTVDHMTTDLPSPRPAMLIYTTAAPNLSLSSSLPVVSETEFGDGSLSSFLCVQQQPESEDKVPSGEFRHECHVPVVSDITRS